MDSVYEVSIINGENRDYHLQQLHRIFETNLESSSCGNETAVISIDGNNKLTYKQLNHAANRIAATLIDQISSRELKPNGDGDWIIAVCMHPSNELIVTLLAIMKTGAAYLPIDATFPESRINHILHEAKPAFVIYEDTAIEGCVFDCSAVASYVDCKTLSSKYDCQNICDDRMLKSVNDSRLALVLYTSGSTGTPKGVRIPHEAILNRLHWQWETFPYSSTEQICVFKTALTFVDSVSEIWSPLLTKRALVVVPQSVTKDPFQLVAILQKHDIERLVLVPTLLKSLLIYLRLEQNAYLLSKLKLWICSGDTLSVSLANEFYDYFPENEYLLCNFYGSTEIMGDVTYFMCRGKDQLRNYTKSIPIGSPIFNTTIHILDAERNPVKVGDIGELFVSGANLAHGYVNDRDKERFSENVEAMESKHCRMYQTGDYASLQADGIIHYEGRKDSQVKIRGHRVDLSEIEKHLLEIIGVKRGIVLCYHADQTDQAILAFASVESTSDLDESKIEKLLRNELPEYMTPHVIIVEQIPLLVNGKIDRQALLQMYENDNNNNGDLESAIEFDLSGVSPNELQMTRDLFETIGEVIGKSARLTISLESNFYALGGNSLNSIYTVAKLRDRGYYIETTDFISAANLREVLNSMTEIEGNNSKNISACETKGKFVAEPLKMEHKKEAIHLISKSFAEKNELSLYVRPKANYSDLVEIYEAIWEFYIEKECSFVIKDEQNRIVGVALSFFADDDIEIPYNEPTSIINEYLKFLEGPIINQLPDDSPVIYTDSMGTHECLSTQDNILAMTYMESETIRLAKEKNLCGVLTTNTSALTQHLARYIFGYETLLDYQVNQYTTKDGAKPFATAPDSYHNMVQWKKL